MHQDLTSFDSACGDIEPKLNQYSKLVTNLTTLQSGLDKLNKKLTPVDQKVAKIDNVLSTSMTFKIPFSKKKKTFTISIRKALEMPGDVNGLGPQTTY